VRFRRPFFSVYSRVYDYLWDNSLTGVLADTIVQELGGIEGTILEVGNGSGLVTRRMVDAGLDVVASEPDPAMRSRFSGRLTGVVCEPWPLEEARSIDGGYGAVVAVNVVHMMDDAAAAVEAMRRLVADNALVVVATPGAQTSVSSVVRTMRELGASRVRRFGFVLVHLLLMPLSVLTNAGVPRDIHAAWITPPERASSVLGITDICVWEHPSSSD